MRSKSILVIDDDENVRSSLAAILSLEGYRVVAAGHLCEAVDYLASNYFDLVLLDIKKPDTLTNELISNLHTLHPKLPVVILAGHPMLNYPDGAERFGAQGYFLKPVDPALLVGCVKDVLCESNIP